MIRMKDYIIDYNQIKGYITINDLINDLKLILEDYKTLEDIIIVILKNSHFDDETIASLFNNNIASRLDDIVSILDTKL